MENEYGWITASSLPKVSVLRDGQLDQSCTVKLVHHVLDEKDESEACVCEAA